MCCLTQILLCCLQSISMVVSLFISIALAFITLKVLYNMIFPKEQQKEQSGYEEEWFGREPPPTNENTTGSPDAGIWPFKIEVSDDVLKDLKARLDNTRYEDPVEDSKFHYGFNPNYLKKVVDYWRNEYDWRKQEKMLNLFPQFKTRIEGIDIHFLHIKPTVPEGSGLRVLPLMVIHGWPGSVVEFYKIIPLLTTPRPGQDFVFEVICPSIPGYGFSESPHRKGFTCRAAARVFLTLMERLGHRKFYIQGGDWGSAISQHMARYYPSRILGMHVNMYFSQFRPWEAVKLVFNAYFPFFISKQEYKLAYPIKRVLKQLLQESGYYHLQTTKPDTIGCSTTDSPAGMAAYMLEKFVFWVNPDNLNLPDGGLTTKFSLDELLTNVMLYWVNNNFTAAVRFYKENLVSIHRADYAKLPCTVPSAVAVFPKELIVIPRTCMSQQMKNLVSYTIMPRGGHFAAFEEPELLADDIWKFISVVEKQ